MPYLEGISNVRGRRIGDSAPPADEMAHVDMERRGQRIHVDWKHKCTSVYLPRYTEHG